MRVGVPAEVKSDEYRVALTPAGADELVRRGHEVWIEHDAGVGAAYDDAAYEGVGAAIGDTEAAWGCDLVLKVKEPQREEYGYLRDDQLLFTYLHLAADADAAAALQRSGATAIAYETVRDDDGRLPLLAPMSGIAGRLAVQAGARYLERHEGGRGVLLGGVAGVSPGSVVVIGGGIVGTNAATVAIGMQAHVAVLDTSLDRLRELDLVIGGRVTLLHSTQLAIAEVVERADLVIGAVLVPGARAPRLVSRELVSKMKPGSVIVDVAVDQGGCVETARPTTHSEPTYTVDDIIHYCVTNMPGAVPVTSTGALTAATLPYAITLADLGLEDAQKQLPGLATGINVRDGAIMNEAVAEALAS